MRARGWAVVVGVLVLLSAGRRAAAELEDDEEDDARVDLHGFVSQGLLLSTANDYLAKSHRGSVEFTEAALNVSRSFGHHLRIAMQLFSRDLGPLGNYRLRFDWFLLDYRHADWLGLRVGRVKVPFGLYNDTSDYDPARVQVLLPQSVYPTTSRDFILAVTGAEVYGRAPLGPAGALEYRLYGGTTFVDLADSSGTPGLTVTSVDVPYTAGGRLLWEPIEGLRLGGSVLATKIDFSAQAGSMSVALRLPAVLWVASAEYAHLRYRFAAEYSRWLVDLESSQPALVPPVSRESERGYVSGTYETSDWFALGLYYSLDFPDVSHRDGRRDRYQHDVAASVRIDLHPHWLLKLEAHFMNGTAELSPTLNDNRPRETLERYWGFFAVKTTAYF